MCNSVTLLVKRIMTKRKTTTFIPFEDIMNNINNWLKKDNNKAQHDLN